MHEFDNVQLCEAEAKQKKERLRKAHDKIIGRVSHVER